MPWWHTASLPLLLSVLCPCTQTLISFHTSSQKLLTVQTVDLWGSSPPLQLSNPCALAMTPHMSQRLALHWPNQGCSPPSRQYLYRYWFVDLSWERAYQYIYILWKEFWNVHLLLIWQFDCPEVTLYGSQDVKIQWLLYSFMGNLGHCLPGGDYRATRDTLPNSSIVWPFHVSML